MVRTWFIGLVFICSSLVVLADPIIAQTDSSVDKDIQAYTDIYNIDGCEVYDPYEKFNRVVYKFNSTIDYFLLRPIAISYDKIVSNYTKNRVGSLIDNIGTPVSTVNHALQFNFTNTMKSFWRFMINTTLGVGGLFDVASKVGLPVNNQGFGDTLGYYGVGPGPYIVIPFIGGTTARGIFDNIFTIENFMPTSVVPRGVNMCYSGTKLVHLRAKLLPFTDHVMKHSLDSYINIRSSIHQNRESSVKYPKNFVCPTKSIVIDTKNEDVPHIRTKRKRKTTK